MRIHRSHMEYAACSVSIAPMRTHPADKSEMGSQLLFGETVIVTDRRDHWRFVTASWDGFSGWVDVRQLHPLTAAAYDEAQTAAVYSLSLLEGLMTAQDFVPLPLGAVLPHYDGLRCQIGEQFFQFSGPVARPGQIPLTGEWVVKLARRYLHAPYLWGGRSPFGIDAAGLAQMVYKLLGIRLLRQPAQQVQQGDAVDFTEQCQVGDLAFFDNGRGHVNHVGIVLPDCYVLHACGSVRIDKLDHFGIYNEMQQRYTHPLRVIKRLLPTLPTAPAEPTSTWVADKLPIVEEAQLALFG